MTQPPRFSPTWLDLREDADARARCGELADLVRSGSHRLVHDLGCGTGSMARWLSARLPGKQHWVLHDRDPDLLALALDRLARFAPDGTVVTAETRLGDLTALEGRDLAGAELVTASALLDLLTAEEVGHLAEVCVVAGCSALFTLSVTGNVAVTPADPLDVEITAAFNDHQRRSVRGRRLLGPDAGRAAADAFTRLGASVLVRPSPWRLGPDDAPLVVEWLRGWVSAAVEQRPDLRVEEYLRRRSAAAAAGRLQVVVQHVDLLARPHPHPP